MFSGTASSLVKAVEFYLNLLDLRIARHTHFFNLQHQVGSCGSDGASCTVYPVKIVLAEGRMVHVICPGFQLRLAAAIKYIGTGRVGGTAVPSQHM